MKKVLFGIMAMVACTTIYGNGADDDFLAGKDVFPGDNDDNEEATLPENEASRPNNPRPPSPSSPRNQAPDPKKPPPSPRPPTNNN